MEGIFKDETSNKGEAKMKGKF